MDGPQAAGRVQTHARLAGLRSLTGPQRWLVVVPASGAVNVTLIVPLRAVLVPASWAVNVASTALDFPLPISPFLALHFGSVRLTDLVPALGGI